jgi:UDP-N-acetylglucosamine 2-epimerase (non-hydrolysing)
MPEELNRVVVDHLGDLLFLHCQDAIDNLTREGIDAPRMKFVGNTMIDTLVALEDRFRAREAAARFGVEPGAFLLVTLHRPALVDGPLLGEAMEALAAVAAEMPVVFPAHPRTVKMLGGNRPEGVQLLDPIGYLDFLSLEADAAAVLTDSGGIQEEAAALGKPVLVMREVTERRESVDAGVSRLVGTSRATIREWSLRLLEDDATYRRMARRIDVYGDGRASERIALALGVGPARSDAGAA